MPARAIFDAELVLRLKKKITDRRDDAQVSNTDNMALVGAITDAAPLQAGPPRCRASGAATMSASKPSWIGPLHLEPRAHGDPMNSAVPLLHDYVIDSARRLPEKVALVAGGARLTYREIDQKSDSLARALVARGVERGDRVVIFADNTPETVIAFWAVLKANGVVVVVNLR